MNVQDFASVVQLGVGLHAGSAILQIYGEIGLQPMIRSIDRLKSLADDKNFPPDVEYEERIREVSSAFDIFKIRMAKEYRGYLLVNALVAAFLTVALAVMAYTAQWEMPLVISVLLVALSTMPAPITLFSFWKDADQELRPLKAKVAAIEKALLG